jgi:membrane-bound lytic murein transglycosylase B
LLRGRHGKEGRMGRGGGAKFGLAKWSAFRLCVLALLMGCLAFPANASARKPSVRDRSFQEFIFSLWPLVEAHGVKRETFDRAFADVRFDPKIVANTIGQPEFVEPIWQYIAGAVSPSRIARGRDLALAERPWLSKASKDYGVDSGVIMGIWGLETDFGAFTGTDDVIQALATLAFIHFQGDYFRNELISALIILDDGKIEPRRMLGSWAGAMGQTQFMPSSFLIYAVDFEGGGRRNIWTSAPDAIGSTANFLAAHGWTRDLPWGFEVRLPDDFSLTDADSSKPAPFSAFAGRGVQRADQAPFPKSGEGRLLLPAGLRGPIFVVTDNFDVIKTYNTSTSYALAVALLGDAIKGGRGLVASWPTSDRPLNVIQVRRLQAKLTKLGYNVGEIDGMVGESVQSAVRAYQERKGLKPDGYANLALLKRIESERE